MIYAILLLQASAAEDPARSWRNPPDCWDGPQSELTHCAIMEYREADQTMARQFERAKAVLERVDREYPPNAAIGQSSHAAALAAGQRAWLEFRIQHCRLYLVGGGSMAPMLEGICLRDITRERTNALAAMALNPATGNPYFEE